MYWHKQFYRTELSAEEFQAKLEALIEVSEVNTVKQHFKRTTVGDGDTVRGEYTDKTFTLWRTNSQLGGYFYPIFKGKMMDVKGKHIIEIKTRLNPIAGILTLAVTLIISYTVLRFGILMGSLELKFILRRALLSVIIILLFQTIPVVCYYPLKKQTLKSLEGYFDLIKQK